MCTTGTVYLTMILGGVIVAANTKDSVITGELADSLVDWAFIWGCDDGLIESRSQICHHRVTRVWENHYRVSLYAKDLPDGNFIVPEYRIVASYLIRRVHDNGFVNVTKRPKSALNE